MSWKVQLLRHETKKQCAYNYWTPTVMEQFDFYGLLVIFFIDFATFSSKFMKFHSIVISLMHIKMQKPFKYFKNVLFTTF